METPAGIISFRIPAHIQIIYSDPEFWDLVHEHGTEVDRLADYDHQMVAALVDWLVTEFRILGLHIFRVACSSNTLALGLFDRHALNVLRTQIRKRPNTKADSVFDSYGLSIPAAPPNADWMGFFSRQSNHLQSHAGQLLIVCVENIANP